MFQSTHPRRVWLCLLKKAHLPRRVSIHTPTQGVTSFHVPPQLDKHVSIHTPTQGVTFASWAKTAPNKVSIHTPTQGVTTGIWLSCHCYGRVSIHTPTQGVTVKSPFSSGNMEVSIHTPTQGVTHIIRHLGKCLWFQSTHPRRVWHMGGVDRTLMPLFQSTHPRRVWLIRINILLFFSGFNPHTHAGCDPVVPTSTDNDGFQSTHPRRVWQ